MQFDMQLEGEKKKKDVWDVRTTQPNVSGHLIDDVFHSIEIDLLLVYIVTLSVNCGCCFHVLGFTRIQAFPALPRASFEAIICNLVHQILHKLLLHLLPHPL